MISLLSGFLFNPWMALGAGAVASPILIHILSRRRFRRVRWAAMDFLLSAHRRNRRRVRFEQLIILALRCLAIALLALAFARPFLSNGRFASLFGGARTEHIIILDDSYSMGAVGRGAGDVGGRGTAFDAGREAVGSIARLVADSSPSDAITLYLASRPNEPVVSLPNASDVKRIELTEALADLRPSQRGGDFDAGLRGIARQIASAPSRANAIVYLVSDFQRKDWIPRSATGGDAQPSGPLESLNILSGDDATVRCMIVNVAPPAVENVAVVDIRADRSQTVAGVPTRFVATIANHSKGLLRDLELGVSIEGRRLPPVIVGEVLPGETVYAPVEVTFDQDGANFVEVELVGAAAHGDGLALDNRRGVAVDVTAAVQVLIVDGEPSADDYRDEVFLLKTALRPAGRATSGNDVTVVEESEFDDLDLAPFHVVILANVGRVSGAGAEKLRAFVTGGGGLIVFAGDLVDVADYNESLHQQGRGLLALPLAGPAEAPAGTDALTIDSWDANHPMFRAFGGSLSELLRQVRIDAFVRVEEADRPTEEGVGDIDDSTSDDVGGKPMVLARLNDAYRSPLIVEKAIGRGRCIFIATSADQEWNNWASSFSYLPFMLETVQYVAGPGAVRRDAIVGGTLACDVDRSVVEPNVALRGPAYPNEPEIMLEPVEKTRASVADGSTVEIANPAERAAAVITFGDTDRVGRYEFLMKRVRGGTMRRFAWVNPDPAESDLTAATEIEMRETAPGVNMTYVAAPSELAMVAERGRSEFWWPVLLAVVVVLMAEQGLAWWFGSRL